MDNLKVMLLILIFAASLNLLMAQDRSLDLTDIPRTTRRFIPTRESGIIGGRPVLSGHPPPVEPVALVLLRVDVTPDKKVAYEVKFTNTGSEPVCIPTEPNISNIEPLKPEPYTYDGAALSLITSDFRGERRVFETITLVDDAHHSHCKKLEQNESFVIRAKSRREIPTDPMLTGNLLIRADWLPFSARVRFADGQIYEDSSSTDSLVSNPLTVCATDCNGSKP
ncbi:MAG TPA: hypothetical protein VN428_09890 [Bryobacteraceae bacterium]|nr:hypothetical protein [Bryobacteraceae bacterium]